MSGVYIVYLPHLLGRIVAVVPGNEIVSKIVCQTSLFLIHRFFNVVNSLSAIIYIKHSHHFEVPLGVIPKNENKNEEVVEILQEEVDRSTPCPGPFPVARVSGKGVFSPPSFIASLWMTCWATLPSQASYPLAP